MYRPFPPPKRATRLATAAALCLAATLALAKSQAPSAEACGCLSPPAPVGEEEFAVNQQAEQIIFEVEEGFVTAHVMIRYAGHPEQFAWIVPVPAVPELGLSPEAGFGLLDEATAPRIDLRVTNACPVSEWACTYASMPQCEEPDGFYEGLDASSGFAGDAGANGTGPSPVEVLDRQVIGSYETITFSAGDTAAAVAWLQNEGFIVNNTMAPYMQPYADAGMFFLASKLIPGAEVSEIKPLSMRFPAPNPMIPLQLTAVAADPHMTITAYIFGDTLFKPDGRELVTVDAAGLAIDANGRSNYPMLLARSIDEAGGEGFVSEYAGSPAIIDFDQGTGCCNGDFDSCNIEGDGVCSCPGNPFDAVDCVGFEPLAEGAEFINALANKHGKLTRLTTRMSAEDMTYDPVFVADTQSFDTGALLLQAERKSLRACEADILNEVQYEGILEQQACATTYCGTGTCVLTEQGAACACDEGSTARQFTDLDGELSITCVPEVAPVDLAAGGLALPNACAGVNCGLGTCLDVGGFPTCQCNDGAAAQVFLPKYPTCRPIVATTEGSGARDYTASIADIPVCSPAPPECGAYGWLEKGSDNRDTGVQCATSVPNAEDLVPVEAPSCTELGFDTGNGGCGGCASGTSGSRSGGLWFYGLCLGLFLVGFRRRRYS